MEAAAVSSEGVLHEGENLVTSKHLYVSSWCECWQVNSLRPLLARRLLFAPDIPCVVMATPARTGPLNRRGRDMGTGQFSSLTKDSNSTRGQWFQFWICTHTPPHRESVGFRPDLR
jgi:hypothetical protein